MDGFAFRTADQVALKSFCTHFHCKVPGRLFSFCDMRTKKMVRLVNHSCALDIDVFTGLAVSIDEDFRESFEFAQNISITKMCIRKFNGEIDFDLTIPRGQSTVEDVTWLYDSTEFEQVHSVSLNGPVHWKWIQDSLQNFSNLTTLYIGGPSLNNLIFPYSARNPILFTNLKIFEISTMKALPNVLHPSERRYIYSDSTSSDTDDSDHDLDENDFIDLRHLTGQDRFENESSYYSNNPDLDSASHISDTHGDSKTYTNSASQNKFHFLNKSRGKFELLSPSDAEEAERGSHVETNRYLRKFSMTTPVADNVYKLLSLVHAPQLSHLRVNYDETLYNIGHLNWRDEPLRKFLQRHAVSLEELILDGEQNDMGNLTRAKTEIYPIPENLRCLFVSIVDVDETLYHNPNPNPNLVPLSLSQNIALRPKRGFSLAKLNTHVVVPIIQSLRRLAALEEKTNLWKHLLRKQKSLESLHCTISAHWGWTVLSTCIENSFSCLQVINIGCSWSHLDDKPFNMEVIGMCLFLKKLTLTSTTVKGRDKKTKRKKGKKLTPKEQLQELADEYLESEKRCKIINFSALISCVMLESIFITCALCESSDLDVLTSLPSLTCVVLMYVGKTRGHGVTVGILQDLLHLRSLNLLLVVEFYRQKHSLNSHRLKKICKSEINTRDCPIISCLVPYTGWGKFVYVGDIRELREVDERVRDDWDD